MTARRRRGLIVTGAGLLCLAGALLLLHAPREAAGQIVGIQSNGGQIGVVDTGCQFPATGQTTAYTAQKGSSTFVVVPDDGTVEAGKTLRYKDNGDGTITDKVTGLMWEKKSNDGDPLHDMFNTYPWSDPSNPTIWKWLDQVNSEGGTGFARHRDWRIPNVKELQSIVDYENFDPAVASAFNTNCVNGATVFTGSCTWAETHYWSSTTYAFFTERAWSVDFSLGGVSALVKADPYSVRAVRGGCGLGPKN